MTRPLPSEGSAPKALTPKSIAANDDLSLPAVLTTSADCITLAIVGDETLEREHSRRFGPQDAERADLYAFEVATTLNIPLTSLFASEIL